MKKLVYLSLLALSLTALASCGSKNNEKEIIISGPASERTFLDSQVKAFFDKKKAEDSSFDYTYKLVDHGEDKVDSEVNDWTAATSPDVYAFASDKTVGLSNNGALAVVPTDTVNYFKDNLTQGAIDSATFNNKVLGYPFTTSNGYFSYVNLGALKAAGVNDNSWQSWTMEKWISFSEENSLKFAYNLPEAFYGAAALTSAGASWSIEYNKQGKISSITSDFDGDKGLKAAKEFYKVVKSSSYSVTQGQANMEGYSFIIDGSWSASVYYGTKPGTKAEDKVANLENPNITTSKIASFEDGTHPRSFIGTKLYGVNPQKSSGNDARLSLLHEIAKYLVTPDVQKTRFEQLSYAPSDKNVAQLAEVTSNPLVRALNDQSADGLVQANLPVNVWNGAKPFFEGLAKLETEDETQIKALLKTYNDLMQNTTDMTPKDDTAK